MATRRKTKSTLKLRARAFALDSLSAVLSLIAVAVVVAHVAA